MKKTVLLFFALMGFLSSRGEVTPTDISTWKNAIYCEATKGQIGTTFDVYVKLRTEILCSGMQCDITLPDGITVESAALCLSNGMYLRSEYVSSGDYRMVIYTDNREVRIAAGSDIEVVKLTLSAAATLTVGEYPIVFSENVIASNTGAAGTDKKPESTTCKLTLTDEVVYDENYGVAFSAFALEPGWTHDDADPAGSHWLVFEATTPQAATKLAYTVTLPAGVGIGTYVFKKNEYLDPYYASDTEFEADDLPDATDNGDGTYRFEGTLPLSAGTTAYIKIPLITDATLAAGVHEATVSDIEFTTGESGSERIYRAAPFTGALIHTTEATTSLDFTGVGGLDNTLIDVTDNPNMLIIANAGQVGNESNVIVDGVCRQLTLTDGAPFENAADFTAEKATYSRTMANTWGTICLPYAQSSTPEMQFYELSVVNVDSDGAGTMTFTPLAEVAANQPAVFRRSGDATSITTTATNAEIQQTLGAMLEHTAAEWTLVGVYEQTTVEEATSPNAFYIKDNKFKRVNEYFIVNPFRAYFEGETSAATKALTFDLLEGEASGIAAVEAGETPHDVYDLNGRKVNSPQLAPGLYIINNVKVLIR